MVIIQVRREEIPNITKNFGSDDDEFAVVIKISDRVAFRFSYEVIELNLTNLQYFAFDVFYKSGSS